MTTQAAEKMSVKLSILDRFLPLWILLAMGFGLLLGNAAPGLSDALDSVKVGSISIPIALGLLVMMYPPLAKVRYDKAAEIAADKRLMTVSLILNWLVGPLVMFTLAWLFLPNDAELRTGLVIVGLARCIAMVLVWTDLSCADREATAVLVAINSVFQVFMFGVMGWFYLHILPSWLGLETTSAEFSFWAIVTSVLLFLGIPPAGRRAKPHPGGEVQGASVVQRRLHPTHLAAGSHRLALHHRPALCPARKADLL